MAITLVLLLTIVMVSSAPRKERKETLQLFELAMLDKLHQPWMKPVKPIKPEYPRKGETMCKEGVCKVEVEDCEDCQYAVPMEFKHVKLGVKKVLHV